MEKIYRYHTYLRQPDSTIISMGISCVLLLWIMAVAMRMVFYLPAGPLMRVTFFLSITVVLLGIMVLTVYKEFRETAFILTDDALIKSSPAATITVPFSSVERFCYRNFFIFGYGVVSVGKEKVRLPFFIQDLGNLIKHVRTNLLTHNRSGSFKASEINRFIHQARVNDLSAERTQKALKPLGRVMGMMAAAGLVVAQALWELPVLLSLAWAMISTGFPLGVYLLSDWWVSQLVSYRLRQEQSAASEIIIPQPDAEAVYVWFGLAGAILYLFSGIFFKTFFWNILHYGI